MFATRTAALRSLRARRSSLTSHSFLSSLPPPAAMTTANGTKSPSTSQPLLPQAAQSLVDSVDAFLFDCDGVIWKGDKLIEGVPHALQALRSSGKKLVFVTNNSTKSRKQYARKFTSLGLDVSEEEIFSSSFAAAMFLKLRNFPREKKVYVIGEEGILEELKQAGFSCLGGPEDGKKKVELKTNFWFEHDKSVGAVVVGLDQYINYYKLQCGMHGCSSMWINTEGAYRSWKTINLPDGFLVRKVPN
ncbi:phosphatase [Musa troglodytarum]|uniref:Phosphatase n=1 Tax=Musa troglodytarum TaxID=320322 RepID=A0A9E7GTB4_9LILI|nr:phosphatase [Musa troglodytarum]